ncbi:MAG: transporter substrate-binding domain-containing protein [Desulfobacter sp.]
MDTAGKGRHFFKAAVLLCLALHSLFWTAPCAADSLMDKIRATGRLRVGFQEDVPPFARFDRDAPEGFSVDMAKILVSFLSKRFAKPILLEPVRLKANQRIPMLVDGRIDIEMGASTQTYDRDLKVDFSLVYYASETTFLVGRSSGIKTVRDLDGKIISAAGGTTNLAWLDQLRQSGQLTPENILVFPTHTLALQALVQGRADAYCADRVLLATKRLETPAPEAWTTLETSVGYEPYAFMLAEGHSDFRDFVNNTLRWTVLTGKYFDIYEQWMGPLGVGPFKMSPSFKEYLGVISYPLPDQWWMH